MRGELVFIENASRQLKTKEEDKLLTIFRELSLLPVFLAEEKFFKSKESIFIRL